MEHIIELLVDNNIIRCRGQSIVKHEIGCKVRSIELNLMQRSVAYLASETGLNDSKMPKRFLSEGNDKTIKKNK